MYHVFFAKFPNWNVLAKARVLMLAKMLKPVGLYHRSAVSASRIARRELL